MSNCSWEFGGASSATAVTVNGYLSSINNVLPIGSLLPKYFFAMCSVNTILPGDERHCNAFPLLNLKPKKLKKFESTNCTFCSIKRSLLDLNFPEYEKMRH